MYRFPTPTPPRLRIEFRGGSIAIDTDDVSETTVDLRGRRHDEATERVIAETTVEQHGNEIVVLVPKRAGGIFGRSPQLALTVTAPRMTALEIESGSADITARGDYGTTRIQTGSGDVTLGHVADSVRLRSGSGDVRAEQIDRDLDITTGSGDVHLGTVTGVVSANTGSGDVRLDAGGKALAVKSGSGDVSVGEAPAELDAKTASGDINLECVRRGDVKARTASGDIRAGVRAGTAALLDVQTISGRVSSDLEASAEPAEGEDRVRLQLETVSGDIDVVRVTRG